MDAKLLKFDTLALHAGQRPDPATGARAVPIYQTTSYVFEDADQAASLFNLERAGHIYSRISNPTVAVLEERVAALEGGVGAVATASGQAALHLAIATLMGAGGHIVSSKSLYGGSTNLLKLTLPRFGIETTFVDPRDPAAFAAAIRPETRLVFAETIGNPGLEVLNLPEVAEVAHDHGLPLLVDNTFATPYLCRPFEHGADLVLHSATKWLGGHGLAIGGVLVDGGGFDWAASGKFPTMTEPYPGYDGLVYLDSYGPSAFHMRARTEGLRDFGACMSPQNAFLILQGVETLPLRMERHMANTREIVKFLATPRGGRVRHPSLARHARGPSPGQEAPAQGRRLDRDLRGQGRSRGRAPLHRGLRARLASGQRGRRQDARDPSGLDHAPPGRRRGARGRRRRRGHDPPLGRARGSGRHHRGPRPGPASRAAGLRDPRWSCS